MPRSINRVARRAVSLSFVSLSLLLPGVISIARAQTPPQPAPTPPLPVPGDPQRSPQPGRRRQPGQPQSPQPQTPQPGTPQGTGQAPTGAPQGARFGQQPPSKPRPYAEVITKDAKTDDGLIRTHQIDDRVYFEIPTAVLGKEMLWVTSLRETQLGTGYGGQQTGDRVVRWEKRGDKILLRSVNYDARAAGEGVIRRTVAASNVEPILQVFDVRAYNDNANNAPVIEVTPLFVGDVTEFSPRRQLGAARIDASRTFLDRVKALPQNVEVDVLATYVAAPPQPSLPGLPPRRREGPQRDTSTDAITAVVHHSIVLLPANPMKPRQFDDRVGFFGTSFYQFGGAENRVEEIQYISRWRLEKKDPTAALSEPVKPIVYYIGPEVPEKWRPYMKQAIEDWQPVFEKAGFKNAIIAKDAPSPTEDPDFDPDDVRYSVVRWFPSTVENASGPSIVDPRSGEILNANIRMYHNVLKLAETWYFTQASPNDPSARKLPLSDEKMGQLLRYVLCHEVGHTLGLRHNMKASSSYTVAQLRNPQFTSQFGDEASIMDYGRFNYVAQPGDGVTRLIPKTGPYDDFAIEWGYKPMAATTTEGEKAELNAIAARQSANPALRWGPGPEDPVAVSDPGQQTEDLSNDPIEATNLGLKNLDRVLGYLVSASTKPGEDYDRLAESYTAVLDQRNRELGHVTALVGGFTETRLHFDQPGVKAPTNYVPLAPARQRQAVQFLLQNGLTTPKSLIRQDILARIEPSGTSNRVLQSQTSLLARLLSDSRLQRMTDFEATRGVANAYTTSQLTDDLRAGVFSELAAPKVSVDPYRRNLQRTMVEAMGAKLAGGTPEFRPIARGALSDIRAACLAAMPKTADRVTRLHLMDLAQTAKQFLEPKG